MNGVDDGTVHIPLGHAFPYYGGVFTDAWMSSNGFILLYDPVNNYGNSQTWVNGCCNGFNPASATSFKYMIAPLWTDLRHDTNVPNSGYFYETGEGGTWFEWRNVVEYGSGNLNTFGLQLWPEGSFDFHYAEVNIQYHNTWIGFTGDVHSQDSAGIYDEVNELFYKTAGEGGMQTAHVTNFTDAETNFGYAWWGQDGGYSSGGPDCSDPLNDPTCPGYEEAYFNQQCSANPLYDPQCPGYNEAYFDQQCQADPLYDQQCPGYEQAYFDQQCSIDPLYDQQCPGYEEAYYNQQCGMDPLYDTGCPGYEEAYYNQQCELDALYDTGCPGYAEAYYDQQCGLDPLYDTGCPGYAEAYFSQQCELDGMYDPACPDYAKAFLKFQCDINPLFDVTCDGYAAAKAEEDAQKLLEQQKYEEEQKALEEQAKAAEEANKVIEQVYEEEPVYKEEEKTIFSEDPIDALLSEEEAFLEEIEKIVEEAAPVEEKIEEKVVVEEIVEEEVVEEPIIVEVVEEIVEEDVADVASEKKLIDIDRVLEIVSNQEQNTQKMSSESAEMSVTSQNDPVFATSDRSERFNALSEALGSEESNDIDAQDVVTAAATVLETQSESVSEEILDDGGSTETMDQTFGEQMTQSFALGGNIGTFLSGEAPNFSKFDIKPPSKDEARDTKKVESLAEKMSDSAIEQNIEKLKEEMQNSGGFDGNQAVTVTLMGHVPNFNQYRSQNLQDQQQWYDGETVYNGQKNVDNTYNLYKMVGSGDEKHKEMVLQQYGR